MTGWQKRLRRIEALRAKALDGTITDAERERLAKMERWLAHVGVSHEMLRARANGQELVQRPKQRRRACADAEERSNRALRALAKRVRARQS